MCSIAEYFYELCHTLTMVSSRKSAIIKPQTYSKGHSLDTVLSSWKRKNLPRKHVHSSFLIWCSWKISFVYVSTAHSQTQCSCSWKYAPLKEARLWDPLQFTLTNFHRSVPPQIFQGNWDSNTVVFNSITPVIYTRYIRILPKSWEGNPCIRAEFFTCHKGNLIKFIIITL